VTSFVVSTLARLFGAGKTKWLDEVREVGC